MYERWAELQSGTSAPASNYADVAATLVTRAVNAVASARVSRAVPPFTHAEALWSPLLAVAALRALPADGNVVDVLQLGSSLAEIFSEIGIQGEDAWRAVARVRLALSGIEVGSSMFWAEGEVQWLAAVNEHEGIRYVNRDALEQLLQWLAIFAEVQPAGASVKPPPSAEILSAAEAAGFRFDDMVAKLTVPPAASTPILEASEAKGEATRKAPKAAAKKAAPQSPAAKEQPTQVKASAAKAPAKKVAETKVSAPVAAKKAAAKKLAASPTTVQPASKLQSPPVDGHPVVDTASIPDVTATGRKAAAKKSAAKKSTTPKL